MAKNILLLAFSLISFCSKAQFGIPEIIDETFQNSVVNIITADLNNDGKKDIITSHYQNQINWYQNSDGGFLASQNISNSITRPFHLDTGDANGDGLIDVLATDNNGNDSRVLLYLNSNNGNGWNQIIIDENIQVSAVKSFFADIENDGDFDIITITDLEITMYKNLGTGNYTNRIIISDSEVANEFYNLTVNDFNNDTYMDFAVHSAHGLQLYLNNADTTFLLTSTIDPNLNAFLTSADVDNDNDIDILSYVNNASDITTFKNDGAGNFSTFEATSFFCENLQNVAFVTTQLNSDIYKDALYIPIINQDIYWKENSQNGNFITPLLIDSTYQYVNLFSDDIDNDSDNDIIWYGINSGARTLGIIKNNMPVLGVNEEENKLLYVFPNPVKDILQFETNEDFIKVEIYDIQGRILLLNSLRENTIDLSDLKTGNYILKIYLNDGVTTTKLLKE